MGLATSIDRMISEEAEAVAGLFCSVVTALPYYNEAAKRSELAKYTADLLRESAKADPDSVLIARAERNIIGFCLSRYDDGLIWLAWFGVHPSHRRKGIASALLTKLEETVRAGRSHKIWCDCRTENHVSRQVLSKHAYRELCTVRDHWYRQDFILWEKLVG